MRLVHDHNGFDVSISRRETADWARHPLGWPCSKLAGKSVFAAFDKNGLVNYRINGTPA